MEPHNSVGIDRDSPVPIYYQICLDMKSRIARREWSLKDRLPTEMELAQQYAVSRITLRQAMAELEKDGLIIKQRGKGTFIHEDPAPMVTKLNYTLTSAQSGAGNRAITAKVLEMRVITDPFPAVCQRLHLRDGEKAIFIRRLFMLNQQPIAISSSYIPARLVPGMEACPLIGNSISTTLREKYRLSPSRVDDCIEAVRATQTECDLMHCDRNSPLVLIEGTSFLQSDEPLEFSCTLWAGDSIRLHLPLRFDTEGFVSEV